MNEKVLVLYTYYESKEYRKNLNFFLNKGVTESKNIDFIFVVNGFKISIDIPKLPNVTVFPRKNIGLDFGAWSEALFSIDYHKYQYFLFINPTVRGPFLPVWVPKEIHWTDLFINFIDEETKLIGTTINYYKGKPHIQSMVIATDLIGLELGIRHKIFEPNIVDMGKGQIILQKEIGYSSLILSHGYQIKCMLSAYKDVDFRVEHKCTDRRTLNKRNASLMANKKYYGDPIFPKSYFGIDVNPFEVIFFKTKRKVNSSVMEKYTEWLLKD